MKRWFTVAAMLVFLLAPLVLKAQTPPTPQIDQLTWELQSAIRANDLVRATNLAGSLDEAVQRRYQAWLVRDAGERVRDVLTWLPADTESLFVLQEPFVIHADDSPSLFYGRPGRQYATDRLMALDEGRAYRGLSGFTVRVVAAGMRNIRSTPSGVPALMPQADVAYFYFLAEPAERGLLGAPNEVVEDRPLWERKARVYSEEPLEAGMDRPMREEATWLSLPLPDLLVVASNRRFLELILRRMAPGTIRRALPDDLPEWQEVNRTAPFWGLRHFSDPGDRTDFSNPKLKSPDVEGGDLGAIGATFHYGVGADTVEARYLSSSEQLPEFLAFDSNDMEGEFEVDQTRQGVWRVRSNLRKRGDWPFHFCMYLLGFGVYD